MAVQVSLTRPDTTTDPATERTVEQSSPITGILRSIILHFPDGCNLLLGIRCYLKNMQILPVVSSIMLNDATEVFDINRTLNQGDSISAVITNQDSVNAHTPSIIFNLEATS
jgi:hypothetical protein